MTDPARLADPIPIVERLPPGAAIILREPNDVARRALAERLAPPCRQRKLVLLIAGDARLARSVHADGLHLSEVATRHALQRWRLWRRPHWIVTAAAHGPAALHRAQRIGADAALLSPVFRPKAIPWPVPSGLFGSPPGSGKVRFRSTRSAGSTWRQHVA